MPKILREHLFVDFSEAFDTIQSGKMEQILLVYSLPKKLFIFTNPSARAGYDTRSIFKRNLTGFLIQSFPSPRLVASPRLKNLVCPTIYP